MKKSILILSCLISLNAQGMDYIKKLLNTGRKDELQKNRIEALDEVKELKSKHNWNEAKVKNALRTLLHAQIIADEIDDEKEVFSISDEERANILKQIDECPYGNIPNFIEDRSKKDKYKCNNKIRELRKIITDVYYGYLNYLSDSNLVKNPLYVRCERVGYANAFFYWLRDTDELAYCYHGERGYMDHHGNYANWDTNRKIGYMTKSFPQNQFPCHHCFEHYYKSGEQDRSCTNCVKEVERTIKQEWANLRAAQEKLDNIDKELEEIRQEERSR